MLKGMRRLIRYGKLREAWEIYEELSSAQLELSLSQLESLEPYKGLDRSSNFNKLLTFLREDTFFDIPIQGNEPKQGFTTTPAQCLHRLTLLLSYFKRNRIKLLTSEFETILFLLTKLRRHTVAASLYVHIGVLSEPPKASTFNQMLAVFLSAATETPTSRTARRLEDFTLRLFFEMACHGVKPDRITYNSLIVADIKNDDMVTAESRVDDMIAKGFQPDQLTYHILIRGYMNRRGEMHSAYTWLGKMIAAGIKPNVVTFNLLLEGLVEDAEGVAEDTTRMIKGLYELMQQQDVAPDVVTMNVMLKWFIRAGDEDGVQELLDGLGKSATGERIAPDVRTFNALIGMHLTKGEETEARRVMEEMVVRGVWPNDVTYGIFVDHFAREDRVDEALEWFMEMKEQGAVPSLTVYNMLLRGLGRRSGKVEGGRMIAEMMWEGMEMDATTYNTLIRGFWGGDEEGEVDVEGAMQLYDTMIYDGIAPTDRTFNQLLHLLAEAEAAGARRSRGRSGTASARFPLHGYRQHNSSDPSLLILESHLLAEMAAHNVPRDAITYSILIRLAVIRSDLLLAERGLQAMLDVNLRPTSHTFAHLVLGYIRAGELDKAEDTVRRMSEPPYLLVPNVTIYTTLMCGYALSAEYHKAREVFREMVERGVRLDIIAYTVLADTLVVTGGRDAVDAVEVLERIAEAEEKEGRGLDRVAATSLITAYGIAGEVRRRRVARTDGEKEDREDSEVCARAVVRIYLRTVEKWAPDRVMVTALLTALCRLDKVAAAARVLEKMRRDGEEGGPRVKLNVIHYNAVLTGMVRSEWEHYRTALRIFEEMVGQSITDDASSGSTSRHLDSNPSVPAPDITTLDILFNGAALHDDWPTVVRLWYIHKQARSDTSLLHRSYAWALRGMLETGDAKGTRQVYADILREREKGLGPVWSQRIGKLLREFGANLGTEIRGGVGIEAAKAVQRRIDNLRRW
ncbi:hypothetical protein BC936DRAFT_136796 [Jimgerdemannia flammicorona]|uniref:Uncharacterized protein n=1 Tax=Jimgerdemannia flammicorona TaxID=994334 RepID=A0A433CYS6_9FUNG|nr:hypothetical protein BC936DRAFT_136796 [Jimgerdemannia flammicorona]